MNLILLRHGQSIWNKENKFTGWTDVDLSEKGICEAKEAGLLLIKNNINVDCAYTSVLKRATKTLEYVLDMFSKDIPVFYSWKLNERHYGSLQGLNKDNARRIYGEEQVHIWRRSYAIRPPALTKDDLRYPGKDLMYKELNETELPLSESLNNVLGRVIEYYNSDIKKQLEIGKDVLVVAHGNTIRAFIKYFEKISDEDIMNLEIPTGKPYIYELDKNLKIVKKYSL